MPLDVVELDVPIVGLKGAAFVLPQAANPVEPARHRMYLKGMLLSHAAAGLLPEWAFFVRCGSCSPVVRRLGRITDSSLLTAAVESLYGQSLLMTHQPLRPADAALLNRAFGELLDRTTRAVAAREGMTRDDR